MKRINNNLIVLVFLIATYGSFAQQKTKKELKEAQKIEKQKQTEALVSSKSFVFVANKAIPTGYRSVDLTTNPNSLSFKPNFIKSDMPFFGRATGSIPYGGGDGGLKFEGVPEGFTIEKGKKNYTLKANVKDKNDNYKIYLTIFFEGGASLQIYSNNRASISYMGSISAI